MQKRFGEVAAPLFRPDLGTLLLFAGLAIWIIVDLLCFIAVATGLRRREYATLLFGALILYFAILTGPVFEARYRMPAAPFMMILASVGSTILYDIILQWKNRKPLS